jgi:hypothetical protein
MKIMNQVEHAETTGAAWKDLNRVGGGEGLIF